MNQPTAITGAQEVNFDGLVGPTHNYAGLSVGNLASVGNAGDVSSPRRAARQGLAKMRRMLELGVPQGVLPPHQRPDPDALAGLGFARSASLADVAAANPGLVPLLASASPMWAANAATVSPSADTPDAKVHFTPANLSSTPHRSFESPQAYGLLRSIFADQDRFVVHEPLPLAAAFSDEGAANHGRLATEHGAMGLHVFVYGRAGDEPLADPATGFPRRQSQLASQVLSASHGHDAIFVRQAQAAIDAGAFHNDVVSVFNQNVLFTHAAAFAGPEATYAALAAAAAPFGVELKVIEVGDDEVPLADAISSYLFNSQLVTLPDGSMTLIAPTEVSETASTAAYLEAAVRDRANPLASVQIMDLRESMRNGGGPACLRLRVVLTEAERAAVTGRCLLDSQTIDELEAWVDKHYRDELRAADLADPAFAAETLAALDELTQLLKLGAIYPFQR